MKSRHLWQDNRTSTSMWSTGERGSAGFAEYLLQRLTPAPCASRNCCVWVHKGFSKYSKAEMSSFLQGLLLVCEVIDLVAPGENQQMLFKVIRCEDRAVIFLLLPKSASVFHQPRKWALSKAWDLWLQLGSLRGVPGGVSHSCRDSVFPHWHMRFRWCLLPFMWGNVMGIPGLPPLCRLCALSHLIKPSVERSAPGKTVLCLCSGVHITGLF